MAIGNTGIGSIPTLATISSAPRKISARTVKHGIEAMYGQRLRGDFTFCKMCFTDRTSMQSFVMR